MTKQSSIRATQTCASCEQLIPLHAWICPHCGAWVADILPASAEVERPAA